MDNFQFYTPTRMIFGKDTHLQVGEIIKRYGFKKVLVHYGGQSARKTGLLDQVIRCLNEQEIGFVELGGVQPNPTLSLVRTGIALALKEEVDFILAIGGGSVIDSAKCIADGAANPEIDVWKFCIKELVPQKALAHGTILTLSASGSEMSNSCVITNEQGGFKRGYATETHRPLFAICNPELTFTVNKYQTGCGTVDIMMHTLERYFAPTTATPLTDRLAEGLLKSVIEAGKIADENLSDYEARATLMWAGSLSHNDLTGAGRNFFMQIHQLEHEVSGMFPEVAHGAGLAALFGSWARSVCQEDCSRFVQYAVRVWNQEMNFETPYQTAAAGIDATVNYFKSIGMPVTLGELGIKTNCLEELAEKCTFYGKRMLPGIRELGKEEILEIYRNAL